jgi:hypothetical protein
MRDDEETANINVNVLPRNDGLIMTPKKLMKPIWKIGI